MKLTLTKREALALVFHVQPHAMATVDDIVKRNDTWKALGIDSLAAAAAEAIRNPRIGIGAEWVDTDATVSGELNDADKKFLLAHLAQGPFDGPNADHLLVINEKLKAA